jgi:hypothetical protein
MLLAQTPSDLFHGLVAQAGPIGIAVRLILFAHHTPDSAPLFLCLEAENVVKKKKYHVDCCAAKAATFFLMCKSHINPDMRVKIPTAMMAKGYSDKESKNRMM